MLMIYPVFIFQVLPIVLGQDPRSIQLLVCGKDICTPMLIAALFTVAKIWKQLKCSSLVEWTKKMYICYVMYIYIKLCIYIFTYTHIHTHTHTYMVKTRNLFKKIRDTKETCQPKMGTIKDRNGKDLKEAEEIARIHRTAQKRF